MKRKVAIFGDSVLRGVVLNKESQRYMFSDAIDWEAIEEKLNVKIDNRSRMGATILHGYKWLSDYLKTEHDFFAAVVEYGGNDCDYYWETVAAHGETKHPPKTAPEVFEETLNKMLDLLVGYGIKPILMTLPPIYSFGYYKWFTKNGLNEENLMKHLGDIEVIGRHQEYYNNIIVATAARRNIELVPVREKFLLRNDLTELLCEDGIHPNERGEQLIIQAFLDKYSV